MNLTLVIAARGRPQQLRDMLKRTVPHIRLASTRVLVCLDADDALNIDGIPELPQDPRIATSIRLREDSVGAKYNRAQIEAGADVFAVGVDCAPIVTPGFDSIILDAASRFPDGIGCVYGEMANGSFPKLQAVTANLADKMGGIYPTEYPFWFIDHHLDDIARMIGRIVCTDIKVDNAVRPSKTTRMRDLGFWLKYYQLGTLRRRALAHAIIHDRDFRAPEWQRHMLASACILTEARSAALNWSLLQNVSEIEMDRGEEGLPDDGYRRIKAAAEARAVEMFNEAQAAGYGLAA